MCTGTKSSTECSLGAAPAQHYSLAAKLGQGIPMATFGSWCLILRMAMEGDTERNSDTTL